MTVNKKLNLSRYKKSMQGMMDFACLIEQADPGLRNRIIEQALAEDIEFTRKVMRKVVLFEELIYLDEGIIAEILASTSPKVIAYALNGMNEEFRTTIMKLVGFREMRHIKEEEEKMGAQSSPSLVLGAQKQVIKIARQLEAKNKFVFELQDCPRFKTKSSKQVA